MRLTKSGLEPAKYYKLKQLHEVTGVPVGAIRRACVDGALPFIRTTDGASAPILVAGRDFTAWLESLKENCVVLSPGETARLRRDGKI
ncbi:MAG: hypothetical protein R3E76_03915 [Planctomycetota bacterium]